ncbi:MAG: DNA repair protein RadC [Oscillochloris sp.]|nr:DNA repair protein RadC [Oscillochloris sp.]
MLENLPAIRLVRDGHQESLTHKEVVIHIRELSAGDQPQYRLESLGSSALSDAEILALLLRRGGSGEHALALAQRLLQTHRGWRGLLQADLHELMAQAGIGEAKAGVIKAALAIGRRLLLAAPEERPQIRSPADVAALLMVEMGHLEQEHLRTVLLDTKNRVQQICTVYIGCVNSTQIRVGEVFREAVRRNSVALVVAHNHPSNDSSPSPEDILVTRQIVEAGKLLDTEVLDHLVR